MMILERDLEKEVIILLKESFEYSFVCLAPNPCTDVKSFFEITAASKTLLLHLELMTSNSKYAFNLVLC